MNDPWSVLESDAMLNRVGSAIASMDCRVGELHWDDHDGWAKNSYLRLAAAALQEVIAAFCEQGIATKGGDNAKESHETGDSGV